MMKNLEIRTRQSLKDWPGVRGISSDAIDEIVEANERRIMKRRVLCNTCMTYKSVSGSCFC